MLFWHDINPAGIVVYIFMPYLGLGALALLGLAVGACLHASAGDK